MENLQLKLKASWPEVKELMKENNIELTDDDLEYEPGMEDELLERLQTKLGKSKQDIIALIESISHNSGLAG